jgi:hypothetical protein
MRFRSWTTGLVVSSLALLALGLWALAPPASVSQLNSQSGATSSPSPALAHRTPGKADSTNEHQPSPAGTRTTAFATPGAAPAPSVRHVDGGGLHRFDKQGLDEAMASAMPEIDACYEEWLKIQPSLGGRMNARFTINTDDGVEGRVSQVSVGDGGAGNIAFEGCILSVISELRFDPPLGGEMHVSYPLAFIPPPVPPEEVQSQLVSLCQRIRSEALRAELANTALDDLMTVVISNLEQQTPGYKVYFDALLPSDVPPVQRKETFKRAISAGLGKAWVCPEFEALWDGKAIPAL